MKRSENPIEIAETRAGHPASQGHASSQRSPSRDGPDGRDGRDGDSVDPRASASRAGGPGRRQLNHPTSRAWGLGTIGRRATARVAVDPAGGPGERVHRPQDPVALGCDGVLTRSDAIPDARTWPDDRSKPRFRADRLSALRGSRDDHPRCGVQQRRRRPNPGRSLSGAIHDRFARHGSLTGDGLEAGPADVTATMKRLLDSAGYATDQSGPLEGWQLRPWIRQAPRPAAGSRRRWRRRPARR